MKAMSLMRKRARYRSHPKTATSTNRPTWSISLERSELQLAELDRTIWGLTISQFCSQLSEYQKDHLMVIWSRKEPWWQPMIYPKTSGLYYSYYFPSFMINAISSGLVKENRRSVKSRNFTDDIGAENRCQPGCEMKSTSDFAVTEWGKSPNFLT